jgi:hypothetical protein
MLIPLGMATPKKIKTILKYICKDFYQICQYLPSILKFNYADKQTFNFVHVFSLCTSYKEGIRIIL